MTFGIFLTAVVVIACVLLSRISHKIGIPVLLVFIILGMLFGSDGFLGISFDNYSFAEQACSAALIFIMFYGGFGTSWEQAKPVAIKASLLSTLGVALTAGLTGLFCRYVLRFDWVESFLLGAVISSTDAASVFSILRSKKLGLKNNTDSMLELESGSNDPCSYMLTLIMLSILGGGISLGAISRMLFFQLALGLVTGAVAAVIARRVLCRFPFTSEGFDMAFLIGTALLSYSLASLMGGNGYLSAYLCGIILGNVKIPNKKALVHFFDGLTGLMQMMIFFLLGLLASPSMIPYIFFPALGIMLFLTFIGRPISVFLLLTPLKCSIPQQLLVSFAGLRGAASIVFAIMAIVNQPGLQNDLFHIVFCIVLLSITFQGSLLPLCAKWLKMSDNQIDVMRTFSDYTEEVDLHLVEVRIQEGHPWSDKLIKELVLPPDTLIIMILRENTHFIPDGNTHVLAGDTIVLGAHPYSGDYVIRLREQEIKNGSKWIGKAISDYSPHSGQLVVMIIRGEETIIPRGDTEIEKGDRLVINDSSDNTLRKDIQKVGQIS